MKRAQWKCPKGRVPLALTKKQWALVTEALGTSSMSGDLLLGRMNGSTARAFEDATREIAQAGGYII